MSHGLLICNTIYQTEKAFGTFNHMSTAAHNMPLCFLEIRTNLNTLYGMAQPQVVFARARKVIGDDIMCEREHFSDDVLSADTACALFISIQKLLIWAWKRLRRKINQTLKFQFNASKMEGGLSDRYSVSLIADIQRLKLSRSHLRHNIIRQQFLGSKLIP